MAGVGCGRCNAGSPRKATSLLATHRDVPAVSNTAGKTMAGERPGEEWEGRERGWGEEGHRREYSWAQKRRDVRQRNAGRLLLQTEDNRAGPWMLRFYTHMSQREPISNSRIKGQLGEGAATAYEDFIPEEPPRSPSQTTLSGATGRRCPQPSARTLVESSREGPHVDQPGAGPRASSGSGQRCRQ